MAGTAAGFVELAVGLCGDAVQTRSWAAIRAGAAALNSLFGFSSFSLKRGQCHLSQRRSVVTRTGGIPPPENCICDCSLPPFAVVVSLLQFAFPTLVPSVRHKIDMTMSATLEVRPVMLQQSALRGVISRCQLSSRDFCVELSDAPFAFECQAGRLLTVLQFPPLPVASAQQRNLMSPPVCRPSFLLLFSISVWLSSLCFCFVALGFRFLVVVAVDLCCCFLQRLSLSCCRRGRSLLFFLATNTENQDESTTE